jgi:hypothetical protein
LPPVSTTPWLPVAKFATGVVDTKFFIFISLFDGIKSDFLFLLGLPDRFPATITI